MEYVASDGAKFTDEDIERWAKDAEEGFPNSEVTWMRGRIWEEDQTPMKAKSIRAPKTLWDLTARKAAEAGISESEWIRAALAQALI